jgi:hypothetical protein
MSDLDRIGGRTKPMSDKERELMEKHGDSLIDASNLPVPDLTRPARQDEGHCLGPDCNCARYGCEPSDCDCDLESGAANCGEHGPYKPPVRKDDSRERVAPYVPPLRPRRLLHAGRSLRDVLDSIRRSEPPRREGANH